MLSILTVNIQATSRRRAEPLLRWLADRPEHVLLLTETSNGDGTAYLLDHFRRAGCHVHHPTLDKDRGAALISRMPVTIRPDIAARLSIPGRAVAATIHTNPAVTVLGIYVPSSDRAPAKVERKRAFLASLTDTLNHLPADERAHLVLGGDYNVITRDHQPPYPGVWLPFEYALFDALTAVGLTDAHHHLTPGIPHHSWYGRAGNGYRFDYLHVGTALRDRLHSGSYLQEPRDQRLTDHAAVTLTLNLPVDTLTIRDTPPVAEPATLF
ncbi:endonuclease/exonuclease/phosphatase family protein [Micromonospora sp. WMMD1082]|uniref:endonuclease/exonuclease/phosphatase family protein n=1 Tax=Micromonospora sp. WMMD1082 TaxID=3016104 RepID=UPI002416359C|nr:endonuclease/exonuclease/phosphatase family protein [Micromonospora sp. WMMD1082]MDG4793074.1 endonuclease/exonuclease/phosphatase family protein [Micromonospora sp. WMMD1082]